MKSKHIKTAKKIISRKPMTKSLKARFKANRFSDTLDDVYRRTAELFDENVSADKALFAHLEQILPCIAFYETLLKKTASKAEAHDLFEAWAFDELEKIAVFLQMIMKTGLWRRTPEIFDRLIDKSFGNAAGFRNVRVDDAKGFARDMLVCPYYETCKKYGCPELTKFFCKSDDITYGNLHPRLVWNRTKTLGTGGDCCDFRLYISEKE